MTRPEKLPSGRWRARVVVGHGRGAQRQSATFDTKTEALRWTNELRVQVQRGDLVRITDGQAVMRDFAQEWLDGLTCRPGTAEAYQACWARLEPTLGDLRLDQLRGPELARTIARLTKAGGKPYSPATLAQTQATLRIMLGAAVREGRLARNPLEGVAKPKVPRKEVRVLSAEQVQALLGRCDPRARPVLVTAVCTGLRQAELLGLRRHRVDFLRRTLAVEEQLLSHRGERRVSTPMLKTQSSRRRLPLPDAALEALAALVEADPELDYFFVSPRSRKPWSRGGFNAGVWKPALKAAGLPSDLGMHVLRHTYASHLIAAGVHVRVIQARLGHASITETMDTYGHLLPDADEETRGVLNALVPPAVTASEPIGSPRSEPSGP